MKAAELARRAEGSASTWSARRRRSRTTRPRRHIVERRERGLFAGHEVHDGPARRSRAIPELLLDGDARTVVSAALCYWADGPEPGPGEGRLPRYAWRDHYALLRERLDALGRSLGGRYRVLVDENQHVDREGARRAGVGFYGKNTMLITREHGSWVVLGTLVTDVEIEPTPPLELDCGRCRLCIDACPTGALDEPGVLDATRCLSYWTQAPAAVPGGVPRGARRLRLRLRHLPGRLSLEPRVEKRRRDDGPPAESVPNVSLVDWLTRDGDELVRSSTGSTCPATTLAWLRRNALLRRRQLGRRRRSARSPSSGRRATIPCSPTPRAGPPPACALC